MMNLRTNALVSRYRTLLRTFPEPGEPSIHIVDFDDWGCFSFVTVGGKTTSYNYDIENPDRLFNQHRTEEEAEQPTSPEAPPNEPASLAPREPPRPADPVLYDHLTKYEKGPPLNPPLWETSSERGPIESKPWEYDKRLGLGGVGGGSLIVKERRRG